MYDGKNPQSNATVERVQQVIHKIVVPKDLDKTFLTV